MSIVAPARSLLRRLDPALLGRLILALYLAVQLVTVVTVASGLGDGGLPRFSVSNLMIDLAERPWTSVELWAGTYPFGYPVILKAFGTGLALYLVQWGLSVGAWLWLARELIVAARNRWVGTIGALWLLGLSLAPDVAIWHQLVMTESLAGTGAVALIALALRWFRTRSATLAWASIPLAIVWMEVRPSNVLWVLGVGALALAAAVVTRRRQLVVVGAIALFLVGGFVSLATPHGSQPILKWVVNVGLKDPETRAFLVDRGMPDSEALRDLGAAQAISSDYIDIVAADPGLAGFREWMDTEASSAYVAWTLSDPGDLVLDAGRSFSASVGSGISVEEADGLIGSATDHRGRLAEEVAAPLGLGVGAAMWVGPQVILVLVIAYVVGLATIAANNRPGCVGEARWSVGWFVLAISPLHLLASFFGDTVEPLRHGLLGSMTLRLALVLLASWAIDALLSGRSSYWRTFAVTRSTATSAVDAVSENDESDIGDRELTSAT